MLMDLKFAFKTGYCRASDHWERPLQGIHYAPCTVFPGTAFVWRRASAPSNNISTKKALMITYNEPLMLLLWGFKYVAFFASVHMWMRASQAAPKGRRHLKSQKRNIRASKTDCALVSNWQWQILSKFFHFHAVFGKNWPNNRLAHSLFRLVPPSGKSWIHHWLKVEPIQWPI